MTAATRTTITDPEVVLDSFEIVAEQLTCLAPAYGLVVINTIRQVCDSLEAKMIAASMETADDSRGAAAAASKDRRASRSKRNKAARRGAAVKKSPKLGDKMDSGDITGEQADLLANADKDSDGAALDDDELIDRVSGMNSDQTRRAIQDWLAQRRAKEAVEAEHARQRRARRVYTYRSRRDDMLHLCATGDDATIKTLKRKIEALGDELYQSDGGRDLRPEHHPRSRDQRNFDAFEALINGDYVDADAGSDLGSAANSVPATESRPPQPIADPRKPERHPQDSPNSKTDNRADDNPNSRPNHNPNSRPNSKGAGRAAAGSRSQPPDSDCSNPDPAESLERPRSTGPSESSRFTTPTRPKRRRNRQPRARTQAIIVFHADWVFGSRVQRANAALPELLGHGPVTDEFIDRYLGADNADIAALVLSGSGHPLWLGRNLRSASQAQVRALILRDRCCQLCGADYAKCDAHHLLPFNAPAKGTTDIDTMVLVCHECHRHLHDNNLTMYWNTTTERWDTRPATSRETPPPRPPPNRKASPTTRPEAA